MPKQHTIHAQLPVKGDSDDKYNPNWLSLTRSLNASWPVCVGAVGNPGNIASGVPGALSTVLWQPANTLLRDQYSFIGPTATENIRIPFDGYYDFWMDWQILDVPAANEELEIRLESAPTSDSGFAAPVFTEVQPRFTKTFFSTKSLDNHFFILHRGVELHANDLVRFRVRVNGGTTFTTTTVITSEFRFTYPIPNQRPI